MLWGNRYWKYATYLRNKLKGHVSLEESLQLDIYGEIGKRQISLNLDNKNYIINHKEISYKKYLYDGGKRESYYSLVITKTIYFSTGKSLSGLAINEDNIENQNYWKLWKKRC